MDLTMQPTSANTIKIRIIKRTSHGLGFYLRNEAETAVVSGLVPGCEAEKSQLVHVGDRIAAINAINVETMPFGQVLTILGKIPLESPVVILLKGPPNCQTHLVTTFEADGSPSTTRFTESLSRTQSRMSAAPSLANLRKCDSSQELLALNSQIEQRLSRIEGLMQGTRSSGAKESSAPNGGAPNGGVVGSDQTRLVNRTSKPNLLTGTNDSQIIPSKTGDNEVDDAQIATRNHVTANPTGLQHVLANRRSSRLDPEMLAAMETLRNRSPSPTSLTARKNVKLKNLIDGKSTMDTLHRQQIESVGCNPHRCTGSLMSAVKPNNAEARSKEDVLVLAKDFIRQYFESIKRLNTPAHDARWTEVETSIQATGSYEFKEQELTYAAKTAWRNSQRCIGRIQWSKLQVFDARFINTPRTMFEALLNHIKYSSNRGNIRSAITIFKQRTNVEQDFRIWNAQLIRYAGYKQDDGSIIGDPASVEFTEVCQKLGWKGPGGRFDVLPLVLSANGQDPECFEIPKEIVIQVYFKHPQFPLFEELELRWYGVPLVSGMLFDVGGIFFPACAFSGWYMSTEIARDLCDVSRYNLIEDIANALEYDTARVTSLWKDQTFLELNKAILHSFQTSNVTVVDHHSAAESFMKHLENEQKLRGGCPADWVWIVPPLGGSLLPVFHQEMLDYRLSPSYDYQEDAWKVHVWKKDKSRLTTQTSKSKRKFGFREIARAVKFSAKLMSKALARRIRATIIFATETGKSERYAKTLFDVFKYGFDANVISADQYDLTHLEHEALVLVVTSTFGNGDPPDNGKDFGAYLHQLHCPDDISSKKSHFNTRVTRLNSSEKVIKQGKPFENNYSLMETGGPLNNIRFAVFGLGSSSYPHFCAFAHYVDQTLNKLGGECILPISTGDELNGQDQSFKKWAHEVFKVACDVFCLGDDVNMADAKAALSQGDSSWTMGRYRLRTVPGGVVEDLQTALSRTHNKNVQTAVLSNRKHLQSKESTRQTVLIHMESQDEIGYQPGDHVAIFAENDSKLVASLMACLCIKSSPNPIQVEAPVEKSMAGMGDVKTWKPLERLPLLPLADLFTSFLDITTPPAQMFLENLASLASDPIEQEQLLLLSKNTDEYESWKRVNWPTLVEVLEEFPSIDVDPTLLLVELPLLQPRFYSISSASLIYPKEIHATVGLVTYLTKLGSGPVHTGVCSSFLNKLSMGGNILYHIRSAHTFHLPDKLTGPIYLIGAGTGVAPFRSFWQHFQTLHTNKQAVSLEVTLIFGCRSSKMDHIYKKEIEELQEQGVIKNFHLALSREAGVPKTYVQNIIPLIGRELLRDLRNREGHVYVCGDVGMAAGVYDAIKEVCISGGLTEVQALNLLNHMRSTERYHEDIFGNYNMSSGY